MTRFGILILLLLVSVGCGTEFGDLDLPDQVTDTGYEGTWQRGNERVKSILAIVKQDDAYRFRYSKISADGRNIVRCDWDGVCEEFVDGEKTSDYRFETSVEAETGRLRVECNGRIEKPTATDVHYIDVQVVAKEGKLLRAFTVEDNSGTYEFKKGPRRDFHKVSDFVLDPPAGWQPPQG